MTVDVVTGEIVPALRAPRDTFGILDQAIRLAEVIADTELVPPTLRKRPDAVVAVVLTGHELGLGPMQSLQTIDLIQGQPTLSPEGMRALVLARGHGLIVEPGDTAATVRCHRREWPPDQWTSFTFTLADAERANLVGKENWTRYPRAMLIARATAEACRATFADVLAGVSYTAEELDATVYPPCDDDQPAVTWGSGRAAREAEGQAFDQGGAPTTPEVPGTTALEARLNALAPEGRAAFRAVVAFLWVEMAALVGGRRGRHDDTG